MLLEVKRVTDKILRDFVAEIPAGVKADLDDYNCQCDRDKQLKYLRVIGVMCHLQNDGSWKVFPYYTVPHDPDCSMATID